jgi:Holliday junction resolvase
MKERDLQAKIIENLELSGWEVNKVIKSNKSGWPDVEAFKNKVTVFIETKTTGKEAKKLQLYRHRKLKAQGFMVFVIDTWEEFILIKHLHLKQHQNGNAVQK